MLATSRDIGDSQDLLFNTFDVGCDTKTIANSQLETERLIPIAAASRYKKAMIAPNGIYSRL